MPERRVGSRYGWVRSLIVCSSSSTYYKGGWQQKVSLVLRGGRSYSAVRTKTTTATAGGPCSSCTPPTTYTLLCVCLSENTYLLLIVSVSENMYYAIVIGQDIR